MTVQKYSARHVKDGKEVRGYAAIGKENGKAFILIPASCDSFSIVEVEKESIIPLL